MMPSSTYLALLALLPALSCASTLSCARPPGTYLPPTTTYTGTFEPHNGGIGYNYHYAVAIYSLPMKRYCNPTDCTILSLTVTDNLGTAYGNPIYDPNAGPGGAWRWRTVIPQQSIATITVRYRHNTTDGVPWAGDKTTADLRYVRIDNDSLYFIFPMGETPGTNLPGTSASYAAPDKHNFGDIAPTGSGIPMLLPAPSTGNLTAKLFWNGPAGTSMTRKIGSGSAVDVKPGSTYQLDTDGKGLQLDLNASDTASPGAITGNLTLTLTCP